MELGMGLESLLSAAPLGVAAVNGHGTMVMVNRATTDMFCYEPGELTNKPISLLIPADLSGSHAENIAKYFENPKPQEMGTGMELLGSRKNGTTFPIQVRLGHWAQEGGGLVVAYIADMTGRKNLAEAQRLAAKWGIIGRMTGDMVHDNNNLLTVVNGYLTMAMEELGSNSTPAGLVAQALRAVDLLTERSSQLLALCRNESTKLRAINLNEIAASMRGMLGILAGKNLDLQTQLEAARAVILGDENQIQQVLMNLVANARYAMPDGGILTICTSNRDDSLLLAVSDTGVGMSPETLGHMFEPFFTTRPAGSGTGLGLTAVHSIVEAHGGKIEVASELGKGTTFTLTFPQMK